jgi:hypothetical protein
MAKRPNPRSYDDVLTLLRNEKFDVAAVPQGANAPAGASRVSKYGCAADIGPGDGKAAPVALLSKPGWVLGGEISRLTDRGYQKFLKTSKLEIPATADILLAIHKFSEELKQAIGALSLYNESLGTTSDRYVYDRVVGRE